MKKKRNLTFVFIIVGIATMSAAEPRLAQVEPSAAQTPQGVEVARSLAELTGGAISPLLVVSLFGGWHWWKTPEEARAKLPWYDQPYIWVTGGVVLLLCFCKDLFGTVAPPLLKKPLDLAELFENKVSAIIACAAFAPLLASVFSATSRETSGVVAPLHFHSLAVMPIVGLSFNLSIIVLPLAIIAFVVVWLTGQAINVLIALSPFGFIDGLLKLIKLAMVVLVLGSALYPPLGIAVSLVIIAIAAWIAPWAFRLTVFGTRLALDVIFSRRAGRRVQTSEPHAFLARRLERIPTRTGGRLRRAEDGRLVFEYRPWLILRRRTVAIPEGSVALCKGLLFPSLLYRTTNLQRMRMLLIFLPRYRSHETEVAGSLAIADLQDSTLIRGLKAVRTWFRDTIGLVSSRGASELKS